MIKVGINGFGRIGRIVLRIILKDFLDKIEVVGINTSGNMNTVGWAHLFEYDTVYHQYPGKVETQGEQLVVDGLTIPIFAEKDPLKIPWEKLGTQVVIEATGVFRTEKELRQHLKGTVQKVLLSAPGKEGRVPPFVIGVNEIDFKKEAVFSAASCTTNCVAPLIKVLDKNFGIAKATMTTIHAYTSDQELLDGSHKDLRRGRSAGVNIIPTSTGAAQATAAVYPQIKGVFAGLAIRVPVVCGSLTDLTILTKRKTSAQEINKAFVLAAKLELKDILGVTNKPLVSADIIGSNLSCLVDLSLTSVVDGDLAKVIAWYDNEWGYARRLVEEVLLAGGK